jgi:hypothetical protein
MTPRFKPSLNFAISLRIVFNREKLTAEDDAFMLAAFKGPYRDEFDDLMKDKGERKTGYIVRTAFAAICLRLYSLWQDGRPNGT